MDSFRSSHKVSTKAGQLQGISRVDVRHDNLVPISGALDHALLGKFEWTYKADILNSENNNDISIKELIGNVSIEKDSILLITDIYLLISTEL